MAHPSRIQDAHAAITFGSPFLWIERVIPRTAQRAIRLRGEVATSKASHPGCPRPLWWSVGQRRGFFGSWRRKGRCLGRSQFGGAHGRRMETMPQFHAQVPHPLADDLPELLPRGGMGTPAVGVLLF